MNADRSNIKDPILKELTSKIIRAAFRVSNGLGCGFLEKAYENALTIELAAEGLKVAVQVPLKVHYRGRIVGDYVADMIVEDKVLVELKATLNHDTVFEAQTINYLRAGGLQVGFPELRTAQDARAQIR